MAEIPAISDVPFGSPDIIRELKLAVDTLAGRIGGNVDYGTIDGVKTKVLNIVHLCNMINQLHESGVTKADLEKLRDITVEAAPIGKIKARAYTNAAQDIYTGPSATKVLIDTIDRDTEGVVDTTNSRIIPNLPGDYVVMGNVCAGSEPSDLRINALILKNGVLASCGTSGSGIQDEIPSQTQDRLVSSSVSDLIYMNGTDDYLELWVLNSSSSASALAYTIEPTVCPINYISVLGPF